MGRFTSTTILLVALMCGRTVVSLAPHDMIRACAFRDRKGKRKHPVWKDAPGGQQYRTSYNMTPGSFSPVLVSSDHFEDNGGDGENESGRVLTPMKWGLVPPWHQGDPFKVPFETNNCRVEGMLEKKTYKVPLHRGHRCVILVDGFYEWKTMKDGKQPYFFYFPPKPDSALSDGECDNMEKLSSAAIGIKDLKEEECCGVGSAETSVQEENRLSAKDNISTMKIEEVTFIKQEGQDSGHRQSLKNQILNELDAKYDGGIENNVRVIGVKKSQSIWDEIENWDTGKRSDSSPVETKTTADKTWVCRDTHAHTEKEDADWTGQKPLTIAGVYDIWRSSKNSEPIYSYSVITVPASKDMDWCHHRMPAILPTEEDVQSWLDSANVPLQKAACLIKPQTCLMSHPVSKKVNNSRCQDVDCAKPVDLSVVNKPKITGSGHLMMSWLSKGQGRTASPSPPVKKGKFDS